MKNIYKIQFIGIAITLFALAMPVFANNISESCSFNGGDVCTDKSDSLPEGATGIDPAKNVSLQFDVYKKADSTAPDCQSGRQLFNAVRHYIAGSTTNYDYVQAGSGMTINYNFNSGVEQQVNRYVGVFYCWSSSQGTSKVALDTLLGSLSTQGQAWSSQEFNLTTRAATINPECAQITSCSNYPVQNDCSRNLCHLNPGCIWTNNSCIAQAAGGGITPTPTGIELINPIGINTFEDLINLIAVWIFNLSIPIAVIIIIYAGIMMLTAGANPGRFKTGANALKYAAIGLAIIFIGKGFVTLIQSILDLRNP